MGARHITHKFYLVATDANRRLILYRLHDYEVILFDSLVAAYELSAFGNEGLATSVSSYQLDNLIL